MTGNSPQHTGAAQTDVPEDLTIPVIPVTPEMAQEWLELRYPNERPVRKSKVRAFRADMESGNWIFSGAPICFDTEGYLIDGQHRLIALKESGTTQYFAVTKLPQKARAVIDTGTTRTLGDVFGYGNHVKGRELAAIVTRLLKYRDGTQGGVGGTFLPSHQEGLKFAEENTKDLQQAVELAVRTHNSPLPVAPSALAAAYFLCHRLAEDQADQFFDRIITGLGLYEGDPAEAYRSRAIRYLNQAQRRLHADDCFRFAIVAWNAERDGRRLYKVQAPRGGWTRDNVPVPH